jgi:hypothetical protein
MTISGNYTAAKAGFEPRGDTIQTLALTECIGRISAWVYVHQAE